MRQKRIDQKIFFDFLMKIYKTFEDKNIEVEDIYVKLFEDEEDITWKAIDVTIRVKSEDYDSLLDIWIELVKMKPRELKHIYVGVEPL